MHAVLKSRCSSGPFLIAHQHPDPYAALRPLVRAEFEASGGAYGPARVWAALRSGGGEPQRARGAASLDPSRPVRVSEKVVRRIMRVFRQVVLSRMCDNF